MNIAVVVSRILLGLVFAAAGIAGFFLINNPPPAPPGLAETFQDVFFRSRWVLFVDGVECLAGILLLANRCVPLALTLLGAVIANILVFHITMAPSGLPVPLVIVALWATLASRYRANFAPLLGRSLPSP